MTTECELVVPGRADQLDAIRELVARSAQEAGLDEQDVFQVQLSVDEACANIIDHAYAGTSGGDIVVRCCWTEEALTITLCDCGKPFDPASIPPPNLDNNLESRTPGGLGLYFMYRMMDEVRFEFKETCNMLTMVKRIKPLPPDRP